MNIEAGPHQARKRRSGCVKLLGFGCGGFLVMLLISAAVFYVMYTDLTAMVLTYRSDTWLEQTQVSETCKDGIRQQRDRLLEAYQDGRISDQQLLETGMNLFNHSLFPGFVQLSTEADVLPKSTLNKDQSQELLKHMSRLTRAMGEHRISGEQYYAVVKPMIGNDEEGMPVLQSGLSVEELLAISAAAQSLADQHQIPDQLFEYPFLESLQAFVDGVVLQAEL